MADPIKKITLKGGVTRYRFVVDAGYVPKKDKATGEVVTDPETGKPVLQRKQLTCTFDTRKEALAEYSRIQHQKANGTFVAPTKTTVAELVDMWLKVSTRDVERA